MTEGTSRAFLGTGWSFPPSFKNQGAQLEMVSGAANIHKSIQLILKTEIGERALRVDFGAGMNDFQFEPITTQLVNGLREIISQAILRHEARVDLEQLSVSQDDELDGLLLIQLIYSIRATNSRFNMVYPFYLNDGRP